MNTHIINTDIEILTNKVLAYDLLKEFCKTRNERIDKNQQSGTLSNRVKFIADKLSKFEIEHKLDIFEDKYTYTLFELKKGQVDNFEDCLYT